MRGLGCDDDHVIMAEDEKGRAIRGHGLIFAPTPDFAKDRAAAVGEAVAAFESPRIGIGRPNDGAIANELGATLLKPRETAASFEFFAQDVGKRFEIARVVARVRFHARRERALGPVHFLRPFFERDAEKFLDKMTEAELRFAEEPRGDHGVEKPVGFEIVRALKEAKIVVGAVENEFVIAERVEKRVHVQTGERVDKFVAVFAADLQQAKLFGISVERIRFGIDGRPWRIDHAGNQRVQTSLICNHKAIGTI